VLVTQNEPAPPVPEAPGTTGDPQVDAALRKLDGLAELPLNEHPAVFEQIHGALTGALGTLDSAAAAVPDGSGTGDAGPGS
jgi:hypothetical protein